MTRETRSIEQRRRNREDVTFTLRNVLKSFRILRLRVEMGMRRSGLDYLLQPAVDELLKIEEKVRQAAEQLETME